MLRRNRMEILMLIKILLGLEHFVKLGSDGPTYYR